MGAVASLASTTSAPVFRCYRRRLRPGGLLLRRLHRRADWRPWATAARLEIEVETATTEANGSSKAKLFATARAQPCAAPSPHFHSTRGGSTSLAASPTNYSARPQLYSVSTQGSRQEARSSHWFVHHRATTGLHYDLKRSAERAEWRPHSSRHCVPGAVRRARWLAPTRARALRPR